jgi:hypothetical protein
MDNFFKIPKTTAIGTSVLLMPIEEASVFFSDRTPWQLRDTLKALRIPILHIGKQHLFNMHTLEKVLAFLLRPGGSGFALPGSDYVKHINKGGDSAIPIVITDKMNERIAGWAGKPGGLRGYNLALRESKKEKKKEAAATS